jgi:hypothetical protein
LLFNCELFTKNRVANLRSNAVKLLGVSTKEIDDIDEGDLSRKKGLNINEVNVGVSERRSRSQRRSGIAFSGGIAPFEKAA